MIEVAERDWLPSLLAQSRRDRGMRAVINQARAIQEYGNVNGAAGLPVLLVGFANGLVSIAPEYVLDVHDWLDIADAQAWVNEQVASGRIVSCAHAPYRRLVKLGVLES